MLIYIYSRILFLEIFSFIIAISIISFSISIKININITSEKNFNHCFKYHI